jgi:hypothetical protein
MLIGSRQQHTVGARPLQIYGQKLFANGQKNDNNPRHCHQPRHVIIVIIVIRGVATQSNRRNTVLD